LTNLNIYIGDNLLDLKPKTSVAFTYSIATVQDIRVRMASHTNNFTLPFTENNRIALGFSDDVQSYTSFPYVKQSAKCVQGGLEILRNGVCYIDDVTDDGFKLAIYSGERSFIDTISGRDLDELDFLSPGPWTPTAIEAHANDTSGVVAPVIDYGRMDTSGPVDVNSDFYLPSIYYHSIVQAILDASGFTAEGDIFSDDDYLKLIVPYSKSEYAYPTKWATDRNFKAIAENVVIVNPVVSTDGLVVFSETLMQDPLGYWNASTTYEPENSDTAADFGYFKIGIFGEFDISVGTAKIGIYKNGVEVAFQSSGVGTVPFFVTIDDQEFNDGDQWDIRVLTLTSTPTITINSITFFVETSLKPHNDFVYFGLLLPEMSQIDFIKDFTTRFGLLIQEKDGIVRFKGIESILIDKGSAVDWTEKRNGTYNSLKFALDGYSQVNNFTYENEDLLINTANSSFSVPNENIDEEQDFVESPFTISETSLKREINALTVPVYNADSTDMYDFAKEPGLRLAYVRARRDFETSVVFDSGTLDYLVAYFIDEEEPRSLNWSFFLGKYYPSFIESLQRAKVLERDYVLTTADINSLDFFKLVFDTDSYYFVNLVRDFLEKSTRVQIFKVL
jgi:hypothetical protein